MVTLSRSKIRFDAGSTENALETVQFLETNRIQVNPAAVKSQFQNPVEREVQTLNKGVAALLIDQSSLGPSFWDYAAESWVHTANHTTGSCSVEGRSPLEIVTGRVLVLLDPRTERLDPAELPTAIPIALFSLVRDDWAAKRESKISGDVRNWTRDDLKRRTTFNAAGASGVIRSMNPGFCSIDNP